MEKYWEHEEIFLDGDHYYDQLIRDIEAAQNYITVEMYIFNDDSLGKEIASHLIKARQRGVKVQIIVDGVGSHNFFNQLYAVFSSAGINVKIFNPLPFYHPYYGKLTFKRKCQVLFDRFWRLNSRNHRKIITIDERIMFTGSFNISAEHTRYHHEAKWKDLGVKVTGENVKIAVLHFKKNWRLKDFFRYRRQIRHLKARRGKHSSLRLNHSLFMKRYYYRDLLQKIDRAKDRIWLTTPYFIPKSKLIHALGKAAQRGVDVQLLISLKTDVRFFQILQFFYYPSLLAKGVKIFHYQETVLHAKNFIIDDWITVGSSNLNHRSLLHDLEVDISIQEQSNKEILIKNFLDSTPVHSEITNQHLKQRSLFDKFLSRLLFLFKYWF